LKTFSFIPFSLWIGISLCSCTGGNKEYVYNETVSNNVYWLTEHYVESVYADFKNGYIQTAYEMRNDPMNEFRNKTPETVSDNLKKEIDSAFEKLNALEPSEQAKDFHQAITDYLNAVKGPLADALLAYCTLDTLDEEQKNALTQKVNEAYDKICEIETGMFEVQKTYFKNVGLKGKEKETD